MDLEEANLSRSEAQMVFLGQKFNLKCSQYNNTYFITLNIFINIFINIVNVIIVI